MEEREMKEFSWTALFIVTSLCAFIFSGVLRFLDDNHTGFFIWSGIALLFLGVASWAGRIMVLPPDKKEQS